MKPDKLVINKDYKIKDALLICQKDKNKKLLTINDQDKKIGILSLDIINAAISHKLDDYPVSIITHYFDNNSPEQAAPSKDFIINRINTLLPPEIIKAINCCAESATRNGKKVYLVGGLVRDLIRNKPSLDIDITLESDGIEFAKLLVKEHIEATIKEEHKEFGTAKVTFNFNDKTVEIDLASTRKEYYKHPGALPTIKEIACPLKEDLLRRDFTVNAMAISIHKDTFGQLIDVFGGINDLKNKTLKVMHSLSFIDDPTRIIRGIEFAVRFNYELSQGTSILAKSCIESGLFDNYCTDRLKIESKPPLNLNNIEVFKNIELFSFYRLFDKSIQWNNSDYLLFNNLLNNINMFNKYINKEQVWLIHFAAILNTLPVQNTENVLDKLYMTNNEKQIVIDGIKLSYKTNNKPLPQKASEIYQFYKGYSPESVIASTFKSNNKRIIENIQNYFENYSKVKIYSNGKTLIDMGLKPGPDFSKILTEIINLKLDGLIFTFKEEVEYIKNKYL